MSAAIYIGNSKKKMQFVFDNTIRIILILVLTILCLTGYSQNDQSKTIDSLLAEMKGAPESINAVDEYNDHIDKVFIDGNPKKNKNLPFFISNTVTIANNIGYKKGSAKANYSLGKFHLSGDNSYSKAIPALLTSRTLYEKLGDSLGVAQCYMQLGLISYMTQYFEDAIKNFKLSLTYYDYHTSTYLMAICYTELKDFNQAKKHFLTAIKAYKKTNNTLSLNECYMYLGKLYVSEGTLDSAYFYLKTAIKIQKSFNRPDQMSRPYALISEYFYKTNQLDSALYYADSSFEITKHRADLISAVISTETLSKVYEKQEQYKQAHSYLKLHQKLKSDATQSSTEQKIAEMKSMFRFEKDMAEEKLRHQEEIRQNNITKYILIISSVFILVIAGGLWSRLQFVRKSKAELQQEKNISENLLLNILPHEIAQELKLKGKAEARDFETVSILFTDFKGFTEQSAKLSAAELVNEINHCFEAFDGIMEKHHIEKIKTIGDAYMAAGGLPVPADASIKNTVLAALEMQAFISKRKAENDAANKPAFEMRVGIHTGPVVAGIVGIKKFQYDVWGDTVNTASRMESSCDVGKVNISQATFETLKDDADFTFESRGKIKAKGKGEMEMFFVERSFSEG